MAPANIPMIVPLCFLIRLKFIRQMSVYGRIRLGDEHHTRIKIIKKTVNSG
jgi:hypothetical protein